MTHQDAQEFISVHLYYELRCLLGAATVWQAFKDADAGHDVSIAMDSAFVHARNLFNFLTPVVQRPRWDIGVSELGPQPQTSAFYDTWREPLHAHVLHTRSRFTPTNVKNGVRINMQVIAFANEVLRLWSELEADPSAAPYAAALKDARERAMKDAANDASKHGMKAPIFA